MSTPGYFYNHHLFTRVLCFLSSNALIWLFWPSSQIYLLKFKSFCQLFEPVVLFCSRCCAILMLLLMSTNFNWPCPGTTLLMTAISIFQAFLWRKNNTVLCFVGTHFEVWIKELSYCVYKIYCQVGRSIACFQNSSVEETKISKFSWKKNSGFKQKHSTFAEKRSRLG